MEYIGQLAAGHLSSLIAGETAERLHVTVEAELVVRDSCGSADYADPAAAPRGLPAEN